MEVEEIKDIHGNKKTIVTSNTGVVMGVFLTRPNSVELRDLEMQARVGEQLLNLWKEAGSPSPTNHTMKSGVTSLEVTFRHNEMELAISFGTEYAFKRLTKFRGEEEDLLTEEVVKVNSDNPYPTVKWVRVGRVKKYGKDAISELLP